jgi:hypothetical protein
VVSPGYNTDIVVEKSFKGSKNSDNQIRLGWEGSGAELMMSNKEIVRQEGTNVRYANGFAGTIEVGKQASTSNSSVLELGEKIETLEIGTESDEIYIGSENRSLVDIAGYGADVNIAENVTGDVHIANNTEGDVFIGSSVAKLEIGYGAPLVEIANNGFMVGVGGTLLIGAYKEEASFGANSELVKIGEDADEIQIGAKSIPSSDEVLLKSEILSHTEAASGTIELPLNSEYIMTTNFSAAAEITLSAAVAGQKNEWALRGSMGATAYTLTFTTPTDVTYNLVSGSYTIAASKKFWFVAKYVTSTSYDIIVKQW